MKTAAASASPHRAPAFFDSAPGTACQGWDSRSNCETVSVAPETLWPLDPPDSDSTFCDQAITPELSLWRKMEWKRLSSGKIKEMCFGQGTTGSERQEPPLSECTLEGGLPEPQAGPWGWTGIRQPPPGLQGGPGHSYMAVRVPAEVLVSHKAGATGGRIPGS